MMRLLEIIRSVIPEFENLAGTASLSGFGPGWLFGILGTVSVSILGLSMGRTRAVMSLLSIYSAFALQFIFPYKELLNNVAGESLSDYWISIGIFVAMYVLTFTIFNFSLIKKRLSSTEFSLFGILIVCLFQIGFLISIILSFLPDDVARNLNSGLYQIFGRPEALFIWAVIPLTVLPFIKRK